jgi:hypothetical protein
MLLHVKHSETISLVYWRNSQVSPSIGLSESSPYPVAKVTRESPKILDDFCDHPRSGFHL